jgi:CubicO group peptidase (beta-lactamase class C family)
MYTSGYSVGQDMKQIVWTKGLCSVGTVILALLVGLGPLVATAVPNVDQRIQPIQNSLLPPVLVRGELVKPTTLSSRMEALHVPGVSVAVMHDGKLEWARGFGVMSIGGPPVTPETLFQAASISKPVTTLAILKLIQAGKLDLDADVNRYLRAWKLPGNEFTQQAPVTFRGLLTHSAGVTVHGFEGYAAGKPIPNLEQVLNGESPANNPPIRVDMEPGKTWRYSGGGFVIVQEVLSDVTGIPFPKLLHDSVLNPLGMKHSTFQQPLPPELLSQAATPYLDDGSAVPGGPHVYPELAAAGLWTTPSDLARYIMGIQQALSGRSKRLISAETARAMLIPGYAIGPVEQQAIGLVVGGSTARKYFNHSGGNAGYRCFLVAYQNGDGAVVMTNGDNGGPLIEAILRTIAYEYGWPDYAPVERTLAVVDPHSFDHDVGAYRFASGEIVTFWRDGSQIRTRILGQQVTNMFPSSESDYFLKVVDARWVFSTDPAGKGSTAVLYQNGRQQLATRLSGVEGQAALDWSIATEKRLKEQTAAIGGDAVLRALIVGIANGKPDYDAMTVDFAEIIRRQLSELRAQLAALGPVVSISFNRVTRVGADVYKVNFEQGDREVRILLDSDGRIHGAKIDAWTK